MNKDHIQPTTGRINLFNSLKLLVAVCLLVASFSAGHEVQGGGIPQSPPQVYFISPSIVQVGDPDFILYVRAHPGIGNYSTWPLSFYWNGQLLIASSVIGEQYQFLIPSHLISATQIAQLTYQFQPSDSTKWFIDVTDAPQPPPSIVMSISPGRFGDDIFNNVVYAHVMYTDGRPVGNTLVYFESSAGDFYFVGGTIPPDVTAFQAFAYKPLRATFTVTPTVAITAHVFSPTGYFTNAITITGVFTRHGSFLPLMQ